MTITYCRMCIAEGSKEKLELGIEETISQVGRDEQHNQSQELFPHPGQKHTVTMLRVDIPKNQHARVQWEAMALTEGLPPLLCSPDLSHHGVP